MGDGVFITATGTDVGKTYISARLVKRREDAVYYKPVMSGGTGDCDYVREFAGAPVFCSYSFTPAVSPHLAARMAGVVIEKEKIAADFERISADARASLPTETTLSVGADNPRERISAGVRASLPTETTLSVGADNPRERICSSCGTVASESMLHSSVVPNGLRSNCSAGRPYVIVEGAGGIFTPLGNGLTQPDIIKMLGLDVIIVADAGLGTINSTVLTVEFAYSRGIGTKGIILNRYDATNPMHTDNRAQIEKYTGLDVLECFAQV